MRSLLARNIRNLRANLNLSQAAVADAAGISRTYMSDVERSLRNVSIDNLSRIATALGVEPWTLLKP